MTSVPIPYEVCLKCGGEWHTPETTEALYKVVCGPAWPPPLSAPLAEIASKRLSFNIVLL